MATFRPQRRVTRLSLSAVPTSTSFPGSLSSAGDENKDSLGLAGRKKRSQSLGGEALAELASAKKDPEELSPRKRARRSLVPGRSILKARPAQTDDVTGVVEELTGTHTFNHTGTLNFTNIGTDKPRISAEVTDGGVKNDTEEKDMTMVTMYGNAVDEADAGEEEEEDDDDVSMDLTDAIGGIKGRKSLLMASASRRVSFAPKAHVRVFTSTHDAEGNPVSSPSSSSPNKPEPAASAEPSSPTPSNPSAAPASLDFSNPTGANARHASHRRTPSVTALPIDDADAQEDESPFSAPQPQRINEQAAHLAWLRANPAQAADLEEEEASLSMEMAADDVTSAFRVQKPSTVEDEELDEGSMAMSEAGDDITRAFSQNTHVLQGMASLGGVNGLGALGFGARKSLSKPSVVVQPPDEDVSGEMEEEHEESESGDMDFTMQQDRSLTGNNGAAGSGVIFDGKTSRRISASGLARRASVAPALASTLLGTTAEEDEDGSGATDDVNMEDVTGALDRSVLEAPAPLQDLMSSTDLGDFLAKPMTPSRIVASPTRDGSASPKKSLADVDRFGTPPPASPSRRRRSASPSKRGVYLPSPRRVDLPPSMAILPVLPSPRRVSLPRLAAPTISPQRVKVEHPQVSGSGYAAPSSLATARTDVVERRTLGLPSPKRSSPAKTSPSAVRVVRMEDEESELSSFHENSVDRIPPSMTIDSFLNATNIQFMEDVFGATKRKSMAAPRDIDDETAEVRKPTLAAHVHAAAARVPLLELLHTAAQELKYGLQENQTCLDEMEVDSQANPPVLFKEWFNATEDERAIMSAQFKMLKTHYTLAVRNEWYDYKTAMMSNLRKGMEDNIELLQKDLEILSITRNSLEASLPDLQAKHARLVVEVEKERARQAELDACDPEHLKTLKEAIKEQGDVLTDFQGESQEVKNQLARLRAKLEETSAQKTENIASITKGRATCEELRCFTKAEVFRLRDELNALQDLNGWELVRFVGADVHLVFCKEVSVGLSLVPKRVRNVQLGLLPWTSTKPGSEDDVRRTITNFLFTRMQTEFSETPEGEAKDILRRIARMWTLSRRLRHELLLARSRFPLSLAPQNQGANLRATVRVFASVPKAAFDVVFEISGEEIVEGSVENVTDGIGATIHPAFGTVDSHELTYVVRDRIARGGRAALVEACSEAQASANGMMMK